MPLSNVSFAEAAGRVRAVAVPMDPERPSGNGADAASDNGARARRSRGGVPAAR